MFFIDLTNLRLQASVHLSSYHLLKDTGFPSTLSNLSTLNIPRDLLPLGVVKWLCEGAVCGDRPSTPLFGLWPHGAPVPRDLDQCWSTQETLCSQVHFTTAQQN